MKNMLKMQKECHLSDTIFWGWEVRHNWPVTFLFGFVTFLKHMGIHPMSVFDMALYTLPKCTYSKNVYVY